MPKIFMPGHLQVHASTAECRELPVIGAALHGLRVPHEEGQGFKLLLCGPACLQVRHDHISYKMRVCLLAR